MTLSYLQTSVPDPSKWPDLIKVVTDPFSLLALIVLVLAVLGLRAIDGTKNQFARTIALLIIVGALVILGFNALRINNLETKGKPAPQKGEKLQATIVFRGSHRVSQPVHVPFQVGSGQVNFGCGETAQPSVSYNLPQGARDVNATAHWANTDNVKGQDQRAIVTGMTVTASGTISGLDRDWIGNCRGGGHGELVLTGTYVIDQPLAAEPTTKSVATVLEPGVDKTFDLPTETDQTTDSCQISISSDKGSYAHAALSIHKVNGRAVGEIISKDGPITARIIDGQLVVTAGNAAS